MSGIIIYKSRYGSTRQYAEWLHEKTGFPLHDFRTCPQDLSDYDTVILGSYIRAGKLSLASWIVSRWQSLKGKTVVVMLVNMTDDPEILKNIIPNSLPSNIAAQLKVFPLSGRYIVDQMSFLDRTLIRMAASIEKRPEAKKQLLSNRDQVNIENLEELLAYILK